MEGSQQPAKPPPSAEEGAGTGATPAPPASPHERIDGLRGWISGIDRQLRTRTYVGAALLAIALGASGVALYFGITNKQDAAQKGDVDAIRGQIAAVQQALGQATKGQENLKSLSQRVGQLEGEVKASNSQSKTTQRQLTVVQNDIDELRNDISSLKSSSTGSGGKTP
jgi:uncharacterized protein HemX